jgi:hypothetical protein
MVPDLTSEYWPVRKLFNQYFCPIFDRPFVFLKRAQAMITLYRIALYNGTKTYSLQSVSLSRPEWSNIFLVQKSRRKKRFMYEQEEAYPF